MLAQVDWTTVALAAIGLASSIVSAVVLVVVKRLELRAAEDARRSEQHADRAQKHADSAIIKKPRKKKPPPHPDG